MEGVCVYLVRKVEEHSVLQWVFHGSIVARPFLNSFVGFFVHPQEEAAARYIRPQLAVVFCVLRGTLICQDEVQLKRDRQDPGVDTVSAVPG